MLMETLKNNIDDLIVALSEVKSIDIKAVMGLDGFVDQILHVVEKRTDANNYSRLNTLGEFGEMISRAAGLSCNVEFIPLQNKLGGNGPIMSNSLSTYGLDITYIGALGIPAINPVFDDLSKKSTILSIANPGLTDAVEFLDGKLMIGKRESLKDVNWNSLKTIVGVERLIKIFDEAKLVGLENWTMLPYMTEIWYGLIDEVLPHISRKDKKFIFFDLADPESRLKNDILEALSVLKGFSLKFNVILGLNQKEAYEIGEVLEITAFNSSMSLQELAVKIGEKLNIYCIVIHPVKEAVCVINGQYYHTYGPYEPNPKLTTGAGDNFNAGFCLGQVLGLSPELSLVLGTATSGYYVRYASSPTIEGLLEFLNTWANM